MINCEQSTTEHFVVALRNTNSRSLHGQNISMMLIGGAKLSRLPQHQSSTTRLCRPFQYLLHPSRLSLILRSPILPFCSLHRCTVLQPFVSDQQHPTTALRPSCIVHFIPFLSRMRNIHCLSLMSS
jgi:hypothetical protein